MILIKLVLSLLAITAAGLPITAASIRPIDKRFATDYPPAVDFNVQQQYLIKDTGFAFLDYALSYREIASWSELNVLLIITPSMETILSTIESINLVIGNVCIPRIQQCHEVNDIASERPYCLSKPALEQLKQLLDPDQKHRQWWIVNKNNGEAVSVIKIVFLKKINKGANLPVNQIKLPSCHPPRQNLAAPRAMSLQEQIDQGCLEQRQAATDIWPEDWEPSNIPAGISIDKRGGHPPITSLYPSNTLIKLSLRALTQGVHAPRTTKRSFRRQSKRQTVLRQPVLSPLQDHYPITSHLPPQSEQRQLLRLPVLPPSRNQDRSISDLRQQSKSKDLWPQTAPSPSQHSYSPIPDLPKWGRTKPRITTQIVSYNPKDSFSTTNGPSGQPDSFVSTRISHSHGASSSRGSVQDEIAHHSDGHFDWHGDYAEASPPSLADNALSEKIDNSPIHSIWEAPQHQSPEDQAFTDRSKRKHFSNMGEFP